MLCRSSVCVFSERFSVDSPPSEFNLSPTTTQRSRTFASHHASLPLKYSAASKENHHEPLFGEYSNHFRCLRCLYCSAADCIDYLFRFRSTKLDPAGFSRTALCAHTLCLPPCSYRIPMGCFPATPPRPVAPAATSPATLSHFFQLSKNAM